MRETMWRLVDGEVVPMPTSPPSGLITISRAVSGQAQERMRVNSAGNVGIGITSPATPLHVYRPQTMGAMGSYNTANALVRIQEASTGQGLYLDGDTIVSDVNGGLGIGTLGPQSIVFGTNGNEVVRISVTGSVGIGKSNPAYPLDVVGTINASAALLINGQKVLTAASLGSAATGDIGVDVQKYDADLDDLADGSLTGSKVGSGIAAGNITTGTLALGRLVPVVVTSNYNSGLTLTGQLAFSGANGNVKLNGNWLSGDGADEGLFVSSNGSVGLGTSNPLDPFHVNTGTMRLGTTGAPTMRMTINSTGGYIQTGTTDASSSIAPLFLRVSTAAR
ncbi:hypothetical protein CCP3SC1_1930001 [Gammaproteobacteria bacterium]